MGTVLREDGAATDTADAVVAVSARIAARREALADRIVERICRDIPDYRLIDDDVRHDVRSITLGQIDLIVESLTSGRPPSENQFSVTRAGGARRVHQGISLESFQRAARLWGHMLWEAVLTDVESDDPVERDAALHIATRVMEHVDHMSTNVAAGYLDELQAVWSDREVVRRDLLDALVCGQGDSERIRRLACSLKLRLEERYAVVVVRGAEALAEEQAEQTLSSRTALRRLVEAARRHLRLSGHSLLVGMRHGEVVALCPVQEAEDLDEVRARADALAEAVADEDACVGVGSCHPTIAGVAPSYAEARDAVDIAVGIGVSGRALHFDEVLIDHMVRSTPHADRILDSTLRPLIGYDQSKQAQLVATLRAYIDSGFNLTRSAEVLQVHPNTVVYRLRRIRELSGRDPHDANDLLLLFLGLKLSELRARP